MRERGQASIETVALIAVALAVTTALLLGIVRFGSPFTSTLVRALSGVIAPGSERAPGLDGLEVELLDGATSPDADGPTLLDVRTHLRARLGRVAGDAAFSGVLQPLVARALPSDVEMKDVEAIGVVGSEREKAWLHLRFHADLITQAAGVLVSSFGPVGNSYSLAKSVGLVEGDLPDSIEAGYRMGDVLVRVRPLRRDIVLRHRRGAGLVVLQDRYDVRDAETP